MLELLIWNCDRLTCDWICGRLRDWRFGGGTQEHLELVEGVEDQVVAYCCSTGHHWDSM